MILPATRQHHLGKLSWWTSGDEPLPRPGTDHSLWIKQATNQFDFLEAMIQEPLLSPHMNKQDFLVGIPFTLEAVYESTQWADFTYPYSWH